MKFESTVAKRLDSVTADAQLTGLYSHYQQTVGLDAMDRAAEAAIALIVSANMGADSKDDADQPIGGQVQSLLTLVAARCDRLARYMYATENQETPHVHTTDCLNTDYVKRNVLAIYRGIMSGEPERALAAIEPLMAQQGWTARDALRNTEVI